MAVKITYETHGVAYPSKVLAQIGGEHMYTITLDEDMDNGSILAKGKFIELDRYEPAEAEGLEAEIVAQAPNGNWYVEIQEAGNALLLYHVPVIEYEFNREIQNYNKYYNEAGQDVRCYGLHKDDIIELSAECFAAGVTPAAGMKVTATKGKWSQKA